MGSIDLLAERAAWQSSDYLADLFPKQLAFFSDPAKTKAAVCGRRAGKTWACAAGLYDAALKNPRSLNPYIALSAVAARRIMWPVLKEFNDRYKLGMRMRDHDLTADLANGASIFCVGADDTRKVEALRGPKYARIILDEAGSFGKALLRYLCDDVLDASLMDYDGDMWLVGTPNAACVGHFHDITTGKSPDVAKVPTHHWTVLDNVHIPHATEWLKRKRLSKGWSEDNPVYRREYLGHWVRDTSSLVFRFDRARHMVAPNPNAQWHRTVLGVDLGASENVATTAMVANSWERYRKSVTARYGKRYAGLIPSTGADELRRLLKTYDASYAVVDPGALGNGYIEEWRMRHQLPVKAAEKRDKFAYIELLNGELDQGRAFIEDNPDTKDLAEELDLLQWNEDRDGFDERFMDHATMAWVYSWRDCYGWSEGDAPTQGPTPGTLEWKEAELAKRKEKLIQDSIRRAAKVTPKQAIDRLRRY